jgi:transcriptional regulator with XRE-family HTH domain
MKTSYRERDYAYGTVMLTLRTAIGLTQEGLGNHLGVSRRAVAEWEAGSSYPKVQHLKELIVLAVQQHAFPTGNEAQEIRVLWKMAHQKVLLDEHWLSALLEQQNFPENASCSNPLREQKLKTHAGAEACPCTQTTYAETEACPSPQVETEEWKGSLIYPTGWGRFALGSPSGEVLYPGQSVEILLAGYRIVGTIHASALGDYFQSMDGTSRCGLCAGMYVIASQCDRRDDTPVCHPSAEGIRTAIPKLAYAAYQA